VNNPEFEAVVIGSGPAGAAIGRLLARWGHAVLILSRPGDETRGLAESLPPSARKLLSAVGFLEAVERAGFLRTTGNTVWWGAREGRVERFNAPDNQSGFQVLRPELDRLLLGAARAAGAHVTADADVRRVRLDDGGAVIEYERGGVAASVTCRFALDCSGWAGLIARQGFRRHEPRFRMQALVGSWSRNGRWDLPDDTHTVVETFEDGWAWSVPTSRTTRQFSVMIDGTTSDLNRGPTLESTYRRELARAVRHDALHTGAELHHVWACDASLYDARQYAGSSFLLVGDAASRIDPLSSFGVKKALASAWVGAVAVHTALAHPNRLPAAFELFSEQEREMYASSLYRSREYAREAFARHPHPFWASRAEVDVRWRDEHDEIQVANRPDVQAAFRALKERHRLEYVINRDVRREKRALIRGNEVVLDDAFVGSDGVAARFFADVDLCRLADMVGRHEQIPDLFESYCRAESGVPLPSFLLALSLLVAQRIVIPAAPPSATIDGRLTGARS
jgi:flavin-dependent dehydrogenase